MVARRPLVASAGAAHDEGVRFERRINADGELLLLLQGGGAFDIPVFAVEAHAQSVGFGQFVLVFDFLKVVVGAHHSIVKAKRVPRGGF